MPSHTSDQHAWFLAARSSRGDTKRDGYLWRDPAPDGGPPSNLRSHFGGSAWAWDPGNWPIRLHSFVPEQPDLNDRNPEVLDAIEAVVRFWLDYGVDGFRVDVIHNLLKDEAFRDDPPNPDFVPGPGADPYFALLHPHSTDQSEVHGLMRWFRYYGDELGMQDAVLGPVHERDPWVLRVQGYGRDPVRTPRAWDGIPGAGFTSGTPWLPVGDEARAENVALLRQGERSWSILHTLRWARAYGALRGATAPGSTREGRRDVPTGQASSSLRDSR